MWDYVAAVHATNYPNFATNKYSLTSSSGVKYEDHALRYRLIVTNAGANGLLKAATLFVWPGEFGNINDPSMFYAEFFRFRP
jgi:hypothetical protein